MEALERIEADLRDLGEMTSRPMFGGPRIDWNDVRFGLLNRGRLDFKVSGASKEDYPARGVGPFRPNDGRRRSLATRCRRSSSMTEGRSAPGPGKRSRPGRSLDKRQESRS